MSEDIADKCSQLKGVLTGNTRTDFSWRCQEAFIDGFLVLFDECGTETMQKDKHISAFVKKYQDYVNKLRSTRPSISDFKIISTIGRGHFGQVQVVKETQSGNVFALKTLKKSEMLAQENVAFFEEERDIMAYGKSRWITSLHYAFQDVQNIYLVMEFHPGGDLLTLLGKQENEVLEEKSAKFYLAEIILALHSLHQLGYVHRDVKPDNILVDQHGHIKLADFGSAAKLGKDEKVYSKMAVGTPEYISPEVLTSMEGSGGGYGVECDWWSLGVIAYEMIFGNPPFTGPSVAVTYSKIMSFKESLTFPSEIQGSLSLKNVIKGLLTDMKTRLGYTDLVAHKFFQDINWSTLEQEKPPYIPTITGVEDTSNFDEFEEEEPTNFGNAPNLIKKGFTGKDLPFVGFTFTKSKITESGSSSVLSEKMETDVNNLGDTNDSHNGMKNGVKNERASLKKMVDELQVLLNKRKDTIECLENEKNILENEKLLKETEIKDLKKRLDIERTERNNCDNKAVKLISEVDLIRKEAHALRKEETKVVFGEQQDILTQLEQDRFVAMKRSQRLEEDLQKQKTVVEERNVKLTKLQQTIDELKEQLKRAKKTETNVTEEDIEKCQLKEKSELTRMRERLMKKMAECSELESQLEHNNSVKRKLDKAEQKVTEVEKENEALCHAIKKLEKEVDDSNDVSKETKQALEEHERKTKRSETLMSKLKEDLSVAKQELESTSSKNKDLEVKLKESRCNFENTLETLKEELNEKSRCIAKLEWTTKYTSTTSGNDENVDHYKCQLEAKNVELKELEAKNKKLQENIENLKTSSEEYAKIREGLEQELIEKENLVESLLTNEETIKTAQDNEDTETRDNNVEVQVTTLNNKNAELNAENKELTGQVEKLIEKCECLLKSKEELEIELNNKTGIQKTIQENVVQLSKEDMLKESMKKDSEEIQDLKAEIVVISNENIELKNKNKEVQSGMRSLNDEMTELKERSKTFEREMKTKLKNVDDLEKTITMLKTTCSMLEGQIEELEIMNDELDERNIQLDIEKKQLVLANEKYEEEKQEELARDKEAVVNNEQLSKDKALIQEYCETIATQQNQLNVSELNLKSLERKMEKEMVAKGKLQNEIEKQKSAMASLDGQHYELKQTFNELKERHEEMFSEHTAMTEHLETLKSMHAEEKLKLVSTSAQQTKLIDFLQSKAESKAAKKKRLGVSSLINSWKHQEDGNNFIPCQWSELQQSLEKERTKCIHLQNELNKTKEELEESKGSNRKCRSHITPSSTVPRSKQSLAVLSALQQSPSRQPSPGTSLTPTSGTKRKSSRSETGSHRPKERMRHNIPHRLTVTLNMRATKCPVCLDSLLFGKQVSKCTECGVVCHCKCSLSLQRTCGLPTQYVEHFSEALREPKSETSILSTPGDDVSDGKTEHFEGWLKVPRNGSAKNGWEQKWVVLDDGKLRIAEERTEQNDNCNTLMLSGDGSDVKVHSAVAGSDLDGVAATDLPYVFCVEATPKTTCWPGQTLYLLAPSFPEKQRWVRTLERVVSSNKDPGNSQKQQKVNGNYLLKMTGDECLDINCTAVLNDKFVILGAEEGLFILPVAKPGKGNTVRQIPGVKNVFQIEMIQELGIALIIAGIERDLLCVDIKQLEVYSKQSREIPSAQGDLKSIENITNCHLFASKKVDEGFFLCAALRNKISVLRFNSSMNSFVVRKEIDSSEPCSCILFSKSKIIIGSNKFYQIDLRHFIVNDFLDCKDTSLSFAIYHASQANSFPIDILQVSPENSSNEEFLLCFNGFGVFVNSNGKRTRKDDMKWTGLPLSFAYQAPYLFVTHFHSMEVCQVPVLNQDNQEPISHKFVEITRPRILGAAMSPGAIYLVSTLQDEIDMLCYQGNLTPVLTNVDQNNSSSSSSDSENVRQGRKRLHTATGVENHRPNERASYETNSLSAFSRHPKRFLRSSLRR